MKPLRARQAASMFVFCAGESWDREKVEVESSVEKGLVNV
jgi:hypothetical protein